MAPKKQKTVFIGMSGGVDSSVTAGILMDQGYNVVGVHLRCWNIDGCAEQDAEDARRAAETLQIPFYVFDFEKEYREKVVEYMVQGYKKGITPNPDVMCNHEIKFGMFFKRAMAMGADYVATGHYVRLKIKNTEDRAKNGERKSSKSYVLSSALDTNKDQSYFLWTLTQKQLKHCLFPLGDLIKKTDVRRLAKKYQLPNAEKKDSQGVCFLGQIKLPEFLDQFVPAKKGKILSIKGEALGEHQGAHHFTIGQRKGLGVGGSPVPLYVARKDIKKNTVVLAPENDASLYANEVALVNVNLIAPGPFYNFAKLRNEGMSVFVRVRYRQDLFPATLYPLKPTTYRLVFGVPQKFVAPGQSAVFYSSKGEMLGGGIIAKAL
jgi:tRNA-specific 2-thiouridylase